MNSLFLRTAKMSALFLLIGAGISNAFASTVYSVDRSIGIGGVSGYIETDGTIGVLGGSNIVDWQLLLDDGLSTYTLFGPGSTSANSELAVTGTAFSASATDLLFDFSAANGQHVLFQNPFLGSAINFWCLDTDAAIQSFCSDSNPDESVGVEIQNFESVDRSGVVSIGSAAVPVPAAVWLFGSGLLGLIGMARRKQIY